MSNYEIGLQLNAWMDVEIFDYFSQIEHGGVEQGSLLAGDLVALLPEQFADVLFARLVGGFFEEVENFFPDVHVFQH